MDFMTDCLPVILILAGIVLLKPYVRRWEESQYKKALKEGSKELQHQIRMTPYHVWRSNQMRNDNK